MSHRSYDDFDLGELASRRAHGFHGDLSDGESLAMYEVTRGAVLSEIMDRMPMPPDLREYVETADSVMMRMFDQAYILGFATACDAIGYHEGWKKDDSGEER